MGRIWVWPWEAADHFRRRSAESEQRSEGVAQVVKADVGSLGDLLHARPVPLGIADRLVGHIARVEEGVAQMHDLPAQADQGDGPVRDRHAVDGALLSLDRQIEVELVEVALRTSKVSAAPSTQKRKTLAARWHSSAAMPLVRRLIYSTDGNGP
jgi:hypothetical protein